MNDTSQQSITPIITIIGTLCAVYLGHWLRSRVDEQKSLEELERYILERRLDSYIQFLSAKDREGLLVAIAKVLAYGSPGIISQIDELYSSLTGDEDLIDATDIRYKNLRRLVIQELKTERLISETDILLRGFWEFIPIPFKKSLLKYFFTLIRLECYNKGMKNKVQDHPKENIAKNWWQFWRRD